MARVLSAILNTYPTPSPTIQDTLTLTIPIYWLCAFRKLETDSSALTLTLALDPWHLTPTVALI